MGRLKEYFLKIYDLREKYTSQTNRKTISRSKFTKNFKLWIENHPSIAENVKQTLLSYWDYFTTQIPNIWLEDIRRIVEDHRGGKLISTIYTGNKEKLDVRCANLHHFSITPSNLKKGHWCRKCARTQLALKKIPKKFEEIQKIVEEQRGGKLHSNKYVNIFTKVKVECEANHVFEITPHKIKLGQWCRKCAGNERGTLEDIRKIVSDKWNGKLHSIKYINAHTKLRVECLKGHVFEITPHHLKQGKWCAKCAGNDPGSLEDVRKIVEDQRGGKLHSTEYVNNRTKMKVECEYKHNFEIIPSDLTQGHWCAECSSGRSELVCRNIFNAIFDAKFPKKRPKWLVNDRGNQMELDGYSKKLALAFEYQGIQHYEFNQHFQKTLEVFEQRVTDDKLKRELCKKNGVTLIEIPYTIEYDQILDHIITKCNEKNIHIPKNGKLINLKELINKAYRKKGAIENDIDRQSQIDDFIPGKLDNHGAVGRSSGDCQKLSFYRQ